MSGQATASLSDTAPVRLVVTTNDPSGAAPQRTEYTLSACASATCHCRDLTLSSSSTAGEAFLFDIHEGTVRPRTLSATPAATHAAKAIADAMTSDVRARLVEVFFAQKAQVFAKFDGKQDTANFDFEEVERHSTLVPLHEVIPYAPLLASLQQDGKDVLVDDQYCVDPRCNCTRSVIGFVALDPRDHTHRNGTRVVDFFVDWQRDLWSNADSDRPLSPAQTRLRNALLAANPSLFAELSRRHRVMRSLYATSAAAASRPTLAPLRATRPTRVGRNDPCPCGSGKKAKRCCQGAGA